VNAQEHMKSPGNNTEVYTVSSGFLVVSCNSDVIHLVSKKGYDVILICTQRKCCWTIRYMYHTCTTFMYTTGLMLSVNFALSNPAL